MLQRGGWQQSCRPGWTVHILSAPHAQYSHHASTLGSKYTIICCEVGVSRAVGQAGRFIFYSLLMHNTPTTSQHQALNIQVYATEKWVAAELYVRLDGSYSTRSSCTILPPHSTSGSEYKSICYSEVSGSRVVGQAGRYIFYPLLMHNTPTTHQHQALNIQVYATARWVAAEL